MALAWLFLMFTSAVENPGTPAGETEGLLLRMALLVALVLVQCIERLFSDALSTGKGMGILAVLGAVLMPLAALASLLAIPFQGALLFWALAGAGYGCLAPLNFRFLSSLGHSTLVICTAAVFALAAILACLVSFSDPVEFRLVMVMLIPVSAAVLCFVDLFADDEGRNNAADTGARPQGVLSWKSAGAVLNHSIFLGFAAYIVADAKGDGSLWVLLGASVVVFIVAIGVAVEGVVGSGRLLDEGVQLRFTIPLEMVSLAPVFVMGEDGMVLCCCLLLIAFIPQEMTNLGAVAEGIRLNRLNVLSTYASSRWANAAGIGVGYGFGFAMGLLQKGHGFLLPTIVPFAMLFLSAFMSSLLFKNRYPRSGLYIDENLPLSDEAGALTRPMSWRKRCDAFSKSIGLSPRQSEVLALLARGYNASYIERTLVISNHTVKSHTYSIYQKAQVHSKQELIERIEAFDPGSAKY